MLRDRRGRNPAIVETYNVETQQGLPLQSISLLQPGDEVAVMPFGAQSDDDIVEIIAIAHVRTSTLQLASGKLFSRISGRGLVSNEYIERATESHKLALERKRA